MTAYGFFHSFYCFLPPSELVETKFFYYSTCFIKAFERDDYRGFSIWKTSLCEKSHLVVAA